MTDRPTAKQRRADLKPWWRRPLVWAAALLALGAPAKAHAYVGPGAGVAFAATVFVLLSTVVVAVVGVLFWPIRKLWRTLRLKRPPNRPQIKRAVIVGLDGLDPVLAQQFMDEGRLPNMKALAERGGFTPLKTTYPAMSPVAWSSFATGVHPPKHGIFDFLTRDRDAYLPVLSSAHVGPPSRMLKLGPWRLPFGKARIRRPGKDITVVAWGTPVHWSIRAANKLAKEGVEAEVIDLRSIRPWDTETVVESVKKTGKLLVVHEDHRTQGFGAEIAAQAGELAFEWLDAPVMRLGAKDVPVAFSRILERAILPQEEDVHAAMSRLAAY